MAEPTIAPSETPIINEPTTEPTNIPEPSESPEPPVVIMPDVEISHAPTAWTNQYVDVTIEFATDANNQSDNATIEWQMAGDIEWFPYIGTFAVEQNTTIYARSTNGINIGQTKEHKIDNIDTVAPTIIEAKIEEESITTTSGNVKIEAQDLEAGLKEIRVYLNGEIYETHEITSDNTIMSDDVVGAER
jgi:hypothetical protein